MTVPVRAYTVEPCFSMGLQIPNAWRVLENGSQICRTDARIHADRIAEAMHDYDVKAIAVIRKRVMEAA